MTPLMVLAPVFVPVSVRVLIPAPVAVRLLVNDTVPVPDESSVAPPVVPARLTTRFVELSAEPVYCSVPAVVVLPRAIVPLAVVVGAPRELVALRFARVVICS